MNNIQDLKPFKRICMTIGNLPTAYIESMSYYECITYLVNYLTREVVPTVNNNSEVVKELQTYVEHYFDNLDVQEEINNKLDDMAESGQLAEIIAQYINLASVLSFDNVEDMKESENLEDGSVCKTLGFYSINDGGSSFYKIREATNEDTPDGITLIALDNNNLLAELINTNNIVNLEQLGCYGDNTHDDTTNFQNAVNYASTNKLRLVGNKEYLITDTITLKGDIKLNKVTNDGNNESFEINSNSNIIDIDLIINNSLSSALLLNGASYNVIKIKKIDSEGVGVTLSPTITKLVTENNLTLNYVEAELNGLQLIAGDWGISYNKFNFDYIVSGSSYYPIYCYAEHNISSTHPAYIGENSFYGGICSTGLYGVYAKSIGEGPSDMCEITGLKLYNISVEGCTNGFYFDNIQYSIIDYPRYQEFDSTNGIIWTLVNNTRYCKFNGTTPIAIPQLDVSGLTNTAISYNLINNKIRTKKGGFVNGKIGKASSEGVYFEPIFNYIEATVSTSLIDLTEQELLPQIIKATNSGNISIKLDKQYNKYGFSDLYIIKTQTTSSIVIYDNEDNELITLSTNKAMRYHLAFNQEDSIEIINVSEI